MTVGSNSSVFRLLAKYSSRPFFKIVDVVFTPCESFKPTIVKPSFI